MAAPGIGPSATPAQGSSPRSSASSPRGPWVVAHRYAILFYSLLGSLVLVPLVGFAGLQGSAIELILAVNLLAALMALESPALRRISLGLLVAVLAARPGTAWLDQANLSAGSLLVGISLALLAAGSALGYATRGRAVAGEQIYAALAAYLLAGFAFGLLYWALNHLVPGSLSLGGVPAAAELTRGTTIYFSFVTQASLGYGDVLPVSDVARGLAVIQVVGGQLYLAVLVARLVGLIRG